MVSFLLRFVISAAFKRFICCKTNWNIALSELLYFMHLPVASSDKRQKWNVALTRKERLLLAPLTITVCLIANKGSQEPLIWNGMEMWLMALEFILSISECLYRHASFFITVIYDLKWNSQWQNWYMTISLNTNNIMADLQLNSVWCYSVGVTNTNGAGNYQKCYVHIKNLSTTALLYPGV